MAATGNLKKVVYTANVKLTLVKHAIKHCRTLYSKGRTGKTDQWVEIANKMIKMYSMKFKGTNLRDFLKNFLDDYKVSLKTHQHLTGVTENEDGTADEYLALEKATADLLQLKKEIEMDEKAEQNAIDLKGKVEEEMRDVAVQGMTKLKDTTNVKGGKAKSKSNSRINLRDVAKESTETLSSFIDSYMSIEKQKMQQTDEHTERRLKIDEKNAEAQLLAQQNLEKMMQIVGHLVPKHPGS